MTTRSALRKASVKTGLPFAQMWSTSCARNIVAKTEPLEFLNNMLALMAYLENYSQNFQIFFAMIMSHFMIKAVPELPFFFLCQFRQLFEDFLDAHGNYVKKGTLFWPLAAWKDKLSPAFS